jgi:hypothetical protein
MSGLVTPSKNGPFWKAENPKADARTAHRQGSQCGQTNIEN